MLLHCLYIYKGDEPPWSRSIIEALHTTTLHIYIYVKEMNPTGLSITEALHTATLLIYIFIYISQAWKRVCKTDNSESPSYLGYSVWMPADVLTNYGSSSLHVQWFSCQNIRADNCDIII